MVKRGKPTDPPKGFGRTLRVGGAKLRVEYYLSLRSQSGRDELDGFLDANNRTILVATWHRGPDSIADAIWHEAKHWKLYYHREEHGKDLMPNGLEERVVSAFEELDAAIMRQNKWLHKLYG